MGLRGPENFKFTEQQKANQEKAGQTALEDFRKKIENPSSAIPKGSEFATRVNSESHITKVDAVLLLKRISDKVFPKNNESSLAYAAVLLESYEEKAPGDFNYEDFQAIKIRKIEAGFSVTGMNAKGETVDFEFPILPQKLEDLRERREAIKREAILDRQKEQIESTYDFAKQAVNDLIAPLKVGGKISGLSGEVYAINEKFAVEFRTDNPFKVKILKLQNQKVLSQTPEVEVGTALAGTDLFIEMTEKTDEKVVEQVDTRLAEEKAKPIQAEQKEAKKESETLSNSKSRLEKYFSGYRIEKSDRKIATGKYQLVGPSEIFLHGKSIESDQNYEYFEIRNPEVYKISKDGQPDRYVVQVQDFGKWGVNEKGIFDVIKTQEGQDGYIDVQNIRQGQEAVAERTNEAMAEVTESEWTKKAQFENNDGLKSGTYKLKETTNLYAYNSEKPHLGKSISVGKTVEITDGKIRVVEGERFVKVKSGNEEGFIKVNALDILDSEKVFAEKSQEKIAETKTDLGKKILDESGAAKFNGDRALEKKTKLRDLFNSESDDEIIITRKGKSPRVAVYDSERNNYYYRKSNGEFGKRAIFLEGDKVVLNKKIPASNDAKVPSSLKVLGKFEISKSGQSVHSVMQEIYKTHPRLQKQIIESGMTEQKYFAMLQDYRRGNTLSIIQPDTSLKAKLEKFEADAVARNELKELEDIDRSNQILKTADQVLDKKYEIKDAKLLDYINDDELWNNLWLKNNPQENEYIDGMERVIAILTDTTSFKLSENEVRNSLRELIQIGLNKHVDLEDVMDMFGKRLRSDLDHDDLVSKVTKNRETIASFKKFDELNEYREKSKQIVDQYRSYAAQGIDYSQTEEYQEWQKEKTKYQSTVDEYINKVLPAARQLAKYHDGILVPAVNLLEAISSMKIKTSVKEEPRDKYKELVKVSAQKIEADFEKTQTFETASKLNVGISNAAFTQLTNEVAKAHQLDNITLERKTAVEALTSVYSIETLLSQNVISFDPNNSGEIFITALPKAFDANNPKLKEVFKIDAQNKASIDESKIDNISKAIDQNKLALQKIGEVFGDESEVKTHINWLEKIEKWFAQEDGRSVELTMEGISEGAVTKPSKAFLERYMSKDAARKEVISKCTYIKSGVETLDPNSLNIALQNSFFTGLRMAKILAAEEPEIQAIVFAGYGRTGGRSQIQRRV